MKTILAAALILASVTSAKAEFLSGNVLLERMTGTAVMQANALGYVIGVADSMYGVAWCPKDGMTAGQLGDLTRKVLEAAPEMRHESADVFVRVAIKNMAPCAKPAAKPQGGSI